MIKNILKFSVFSLLLLASRFIYADDAQVEFEIRLNTTFTNVMNATQKNAVLYTSKPEELYKLLDTELSRLFDFGLITKRITGKYYKQFSKQELAEFETYFKHSLFDNFSSFLINPENLKSFKKSTNYTLGHFTLSPSNPKKSNQIVILKYKEKSYNLSLSLFKENNKWMGENIILDNLNVGLNYRNQFYALFEKHKSMEAVMNNWKSADELRKETEKEMGVESTEKK